jgi:hypothetical protein
MVQLMVIGLAAWRFAVPQLATMLTGNGADTPGEHARRRAFVVETAHRLAGVKPELAPPS